MDRARQAALMALRNVVDPEVGLDLVSMGLVYGIEASPDVLHVTISFTSAGCPLGGTIYAMASEALAGVAGSRRVQLDVTLDPPWSPEMISEQGRQALRA